MNFELLKSSTNTFLDFEASGLHEDSYPIEIGIFSGGGNSPGYDSLIRPESHWNHWSIESQSIHGIPRERLFDLGKPANQVRLELNERFAGEILCVDSAWDIKWMNQLYKGSDLKQNFTLMNIRNYLSDDGNLLSESKFALYMPGIIRHRAYQDAIDMRKAWIKLIDEKIKENELLN